MVKGGVKSILRGWKKTSWRPTQSREHIYKKVPYGTSAVVVSWVIFDHFILGKKYKTAAVAEKMLKFWFVLIAVIFSLRDIISACDDDNYEPVEVLARQNPISSTLAKAYGLPYTNPWDSYYYQTSPRVPGFFFNNRLF